MDDGILASVGFLWCFVEQNVLAFFGGAGVLASVWLRVAGLRKTSISQ